MKTPQNFNRRVSNTRMNHNTFSKVQPKGSTFQRHTTMKKVQPGFNNRKPGNTFNRPVKKPFNGGMTPKPRPFPKPLDPGIGNGKPGNGGITRPGKNPFTGIGSTKPRPFPKPLDPGIGNGKPGNGGITPPKPGMGAPKPRPRPRPPVGNGPPKPRPTNPMHPKPGQGNGNHHGHHNGHHNGNHHGHHNGHHNHWHNHRPRYSWWWFNYCTPLRTCVPGNYQYCNYVYPTCDYVAPSGVVVEDVRWFLGLKGLMLPGKGIGIETIAANSPAAEVGLQPGMVITKCNGVVITDNEVFGQVIAQSGGVLEMELLESIEGEPLQATVQMTQLPAASF
ncbi:PDZ domain-containing protein [Gimesia panareensis]|nr:PDZ domain-containing protein [Gimesia panareensis]